MKQIVTLGMRHTQTLYFEYYQKKEKSLPLELRRGFTKSSLLKTETWVQVTERCFVSSYGRVMRKQKNGTDVIVNPNEYTSNNTAIYILDGKKFKINSLVAGAFGAIGVGNYALHINRDNEDNRIDNLKRVSSGRTSLYNGLPSRVRTEQEVILEYDLYGNLVRRWENAAQASEACQYRKGDILLCAEGIGYTSSNRIWAFENESEYGKRALSVKKRVKAIEPFLIKGYRDGMEYVFITVDKASLYTGVNKYLLFAMCMTGRVCDGWRFDYNGEKYKDGEFQWNF